MIEMQMCEEYVPDRCTVPIKVISMVMVYQRGARFKRFPQVCAVCPAAQVARVARAFGGHMGLSGAESPMPFINP
jgi:hypothetical protein